MLFRQKMRVGFESSRRKDCRFSYLFAMKPSFPNLEEKNVSQRHDVNILDDILEKVVETVESSKKEIFEIGEQMRQEFEELQKELEATKILVKTTIDEGEKLEQLTRSARKRLTEVSKQFTEFTEKDIQTAYEHAHQLQMKLSMNQQNEKQLRDRRDDLERRLVRLQTTITRAEGLVVQTSVVLNYLNSDFSQVNDLIEDAKQKQEFGFRIIEAQEEERRRLSREIHDGPAQMLANVMMRADLIDLISKEQGTNKALAEVRNLRSMVRSALVEVRKIIYDLRPMALDDLGLIPTLKRYLSTVEEYYKIQVKFIQLGKEKRLSTKLEVAIFRLIQEGVQNACKHAKSSVVEVKIDLTKQAVIVIKDNGIGFQCETNGENKFGLIGMRERVDLLKGELTIDSTVDKGTTILIQIPFNTYSGEMMEGINNENTNRHYR